MSRSFIFAMVIGGCFCTAKALSREISLNAVESMALESNPDLRILSKESHLIALDIDQVQAVYQPNLSVSGGFAREQTVDESRQGPLLSLGARWNLYRGGQDSDQIKIFQQQKISVDLEIAKTKAKLLGEVRTIYYSAMTSKKKADLIEKEIASIAKLERLAHHRISAGLATVTDEIEFQLREQELQSDLLSAQNEYEQFISELKVIIKVPNGEDIELIELKGEESSEVSPLKLEASLTAKIVKNEKEIFLLKKSLVGDSYRPTLNLYADIGKLTPEPWNANFKVESEVGIIFTLPIYDGGQRRIRERIAALDVAKVDDRLEKSLIEVELLARSIEIDQKNLEKAEILNQKRLIGAEKYYHSTMNEYERGVKNSPDVLGATERRFAAKMKYLDLDLQRRLIDVKRSNIYGVDQKSIGEER